MTDHIALAIEELAAKIAVLTDLHDKLVSFRREWPHTAAAMTPASPRATLGDVVAGTAAPTRTGPRPDKGVQTEVVVLAAIEQTRVGLRLRELVERVSRPKAAVKRALGILAQARKIHNYGAGRASTWLPGPDPKRAPVPGAPTPPAERETTLGTPAEERDKAVERRIANGGATLEQLITVLPALTGDDKAIAPAVHLGNSLRRLEIRKKVEHRGDRYILAAR